MSSQASAKVGPGPLTASNTNTSSNNKTLLSDPTFQAIHNAFLLGWNLMELKSRIQITACILSLNPGVVKNALNPVASIQPAAQPPSQPIATAQPQSETGQNNPPDSIDSLLENVVLKDVIAWKDVQEKLAQSNIPTSQEKSLSTELRDNVWLTSVLRAIFMQIATLHVKRFPKSDVTDTIYDIHPPSEPASQSQPQPASQPPDAIGQKNDKNGQKVFPYLYLYPDSKFDYANVGIRMIKQDDVGNNNIDIDSFVKKFRIYAVTRRAINCLTLLLTTPQDSLEPATIACYQKRLVPKVLSQIDQSTLDCEKLPKLEDKDIKDAIKVLSDVAIRLLEGWDSFLRETFYVETNTQNGDPDSSSYEIELVAYEAGRSLAALSWGVSVALVPLENIFPPETGNDQNDQIKDKLNKKAQDTWMNVFNDRDVNHVQHQIAALSTALDEAYYRINKDVKPPGSDDPLVPPNLDLPSQAIQTVKHSLDYWERAIARICEEKKPLAAPMPAKTQPENYVPVSAPAQGVNATPAQQNTTPTTFPQLREITSIFSILPQKATPTPLATQPPPPSKPLDWDTSKTLRTELIQQSTVWQSLILSQQGLRSFTVETVTQKILNDFMQDFEEATSKEIFNSGAFWWTLGIIIVIIGLGIFFVATFPNLINNINSTPVIITTIVATLGAIATPFVNGFLGKLSKIGSFFGSAGTALEKALQDGYAEILIEFDYLNHNVGVTFPLIEFFVWEDIKFGDNPIEDGYDFLVNVFWTTQDREEEIQRVARAAFGPIGAFVGGSLKLGDKGTKKPSPSNNGSKQPDQQSKTPSPTGNPGKSKQPVSNVPSVPSVSNREHGS